jgi:hypothetical protein
MTFQLPGITIEVAKECSGIRSSLAVVVLEVVEAGLRDRVRPLTIADSPWEYGG